MCTERDALVEAIETMSDRGNLLVVYEPQNAIHRLTKQIKVRSSRLSRESLRKSSHG
ncbi:transposase [Micromonospora arborensis]|uniref:transposase n=1 Tax=Micromonospora arborensis TaxID=2116518 RepID=UPI003712D64D